MKVWINKIRERYSGGMILIAADTKEEAIRIYRSDKRFEYMWSYFDDEIIDYYYREDGWQEMTMLTANVDVAQVIAAEGYSE